MSDEVLSAEFLAAAAEAEALVPGIGWALLAMTAAGLGGIELYRILKSADSEQAKTRTEVVEGCDQPNNQRCKEDRAEILKQYAKLGKELRKYDPVADAVGGFITKGGKLTKPCGHYKEIKDLQQGLKKCASLGRGRYTRRSIARHGLDTCWCRSRSAKRSGVHAGRQRAYHEENAHHCCVAWMGTRLSGEATACSPQSKVIERTGFRAPLLKDRSLHDEGGKSLEDRVIFRERIRRCHVVLLRKENASTNNR